MADDERGGECKISFASETLLRNQLASQFVEWISPSAKAVKVNRIAAAAR